MSFYRITTAVLLLMSVGTLALIIPILVSIVKNLDNGSAFLGRFLGGGFIVVLLLVGVPSLIASIRAFTENPEKKAENEYIFKDITFRYWYVFIFFSMAAVWYLMVLLDTTS